MLRAHWQSTVERSRFHGAVVAGGERWEIHFVEVQRTDLDWLVKCVLVGPRVLHVTLRCRSGVNHTQTAQRLMSALRGWLTAGDYRDAAYIDVEDGLGLTA